ncbi:hypothetical protein [Variovorax sp. Root434]|uniref:hypothetical protein n=1 Tax=Variovorax sp. Root434 TaxID=1736536 RepID=UPI0012FB2CD4|nr:hypothetical protein [Variovorax sp. Root434]
MSSALDDLDDRIEAAHAALLAWTSEQMACAGALLRIDHRGEVVATRGLTRPGDHRCGSEAGDPEGDDGPGMAGDGDGDGDGAGTGAARTRERSGCRARSTIWTTGSKRRMPRCWHGPPSRWHAPGRCCASTIAEKWWRPGD